jgi:hypothetical protein
LIWSSTTLKKHSRMCWWNSKTGKASLTEYLIAAYNYTNLSESVAFASEIFRAFQSNE